MREFTLKQGFNKALNTAERRLQRSRLRSKPIVIDIVVTKACNLACTFCKDYEHPGAKKIDRENFERVAEQLFPTARWVNVCSGGEPYLHTGLEDLLRLGQRHKAQRWVLSNGTLLDEERMRRIVAEGLITLHGFSVDGIEARTVETIRVNASLPKILANIDMLLRLREQERSQDRGVVIRYALMRRNIEELPAAVRYWGERGIDRVDTGYLSIANGIDPQESLFYHQDLMKRVFDEAKKVAEGYPSLMLRLAPTVDDEREKESSPERCSAPWDFVMIDTSGNVLPCYRAFEAISMGNVYGAEGLPFDQIWNSPDYRELRRTVNDDSCEKHHPYCKVCENRFGWGRVGAHLGDETWNKVVFEGVEDAPAIDHRRKGFKSYEESSRTADSP